MGPPGPMGPAGPMGPPGPSGAMGTTGLTAVGSVGGGIASWQVDRERYRITPIMEDGSPGPELDLLPLFERVSMR